VFGFRIHTRMFSLSIIISYTGTRANLQRLRLEGAGDPTHTDTYVSV